MDLKLVTIFIPKRIKYPEIVIKQGIPKTSPGIPSTFFQFVFWRD
jgi:hypothetical protein